jgi:hypothetical protein
MLRGIPYVLLNQRTTNAKGGVSSFVSEVNTDEMKTLANEFSVGPTISPTLTGRTKASFVSYTKGRQ